MKFEFIILKYFVSLQICFVNKCNVVLLNLRRERDLTDTLEAHNPKTVRQKNVIHVHLELPKLRKTKCTRINFF